MWLNGAFVCAVEAHLESDQGKCMRLDGATVGAVEACLATVLDLNIVLGSFETPTY